MTKILLILMVKNESKIIERCLESTLPIVDAISVLDTGSTDNTKEIIELFAKKHDIICNIVDSSFIDFGTSRTESFHVAYKFLKTTLKWDEKNSFALLLDADHILKINKDVFDKHTMIGEYDHYKIKQFDTTAYFNIRLIRMSEPWICVGKTHEFWAIKDNYFNHIGAVVQDKDLIWIDDKSDGGCKSDKFERDEKLLLNGIDEIKHQEDYNSITLKSRYYFYLGQTYYCMNKFLKSIENYKIRIETGGWEEETWFAMSMIVKSYVHLNKNENTDKYLPEIQSWALRAFNFRNIRIETMYIFVEELIRLRKFEMAEQYIENYSDIPLPEKELLYLDEAMYNYGFLFLKVKLKEDRGDEDVLPLLLSLLDKVKPHQRNVVVEHMIKYLQILQLQFLPFYLSHIPKSLSLFYDHVNENYKLLLDNNLLFLDKDYLQMSVPATEFKNTSNLTGVVLLENNFYISKENEFGNLNFEKNCFEKIKNINNYFHENCSIKSVFPWHINEEKQNNTPVLFSFCQSSLPAVSFKDDQLLTLLTSNIESTLGKFTMVVFAICNNKKQLVSYSFPVCLEKLQITLICSFTFNKIKNKCSLIYFTKSDNYFSPRLCEFSFDKINFQKLN